ncbi:MAG: hypothetical protein ACJ8DZ_02310 [Allosphingosinicella sp.]
MADAKPFASLSSGLLARKGGAKPAMRPQGFASFGSNLEDLGWNDMGSHEPYEHVPTPIDALTPAPKVRAVPVEEEAPVIEAPVIEIVQAIVEPVVEAPEPPPVVEQQRALRRRFARSAPKQAPAEVVPLPRPHAAASGKAKSAFTLRLDPDRHLKLRLACALTGCSAQALVTEALDHYLATHPEVGALAERVPAEAGQRSR